MCQLGFNILKLCFLCGEISYLDEERQPLMDFDEDIQSEHDEPSAASPGLRRRTLFAASDLDLSV